MWTQRTPLARPSFIGVLHLLPLPGAPQAGGPLSEVIRRAVSDARVLQAAGADAMILENLGDAPFAGDVVSPTTIACMTAVALRVREAVPGLPLGINVLRNDAGAALGIAHAVDASFIRVNVHTGVMVTDQGVLTGRARETLIHRRLLSSDVRIAADVLVKHAVPLGEPDVEDVARDTALRGCADALIITGNGTGRPLDPDRLARARAAVPGVPLWAGSGTTPTTALALGPHIEAAIVGTWLHAEGDLRQPLDPKRCEAISAALKGG